MKEKSATPQDAAAVILLNEARDEVLWAQRNPQLAFLGGWHAFPGGKLEASDAQVKIENCADAELGKFIACAAREAFEETGVLLARGGERLTRGQRASLHDDLMSDRMTFAEILEHWNLWIDANDFQYAGFWTTPQFSPVRFKTRFFLAACPPKQTAYAAISELQNVEFIKPFAALEKWKNSQVLISPPVLLSLKTLAEFSTPRRGDAEKTILKNSSSPRFCVKELLENSQAVGGEIRYIELNSRVICFPLKTDTLPPATHTNCFIVGRKNFVVIDAAAKDKTEQDGLHSLIDSLVEKGCVCQAIIVTHSHRDHTGGETALQTHLLDRFDLRVPIAAHRLTANDLAGKIAVQKIIEDGETFDLEDEAGEKFELKTLHAPGHARGLLAFYDEEFGFLLPGDNVVGYGSVVIAPLEGDMKIYLASLDKLKNLPNLKFLCGSHGAAVWDAPGKIEEYVRHRLERERQVLEAFASGAKTAREIVGQIYIKLEPELLQLAEKSVEAHLEKLHDEKKISR